MSDSKYELNIEIEALSKEISDIKMGIVNQNANLVKELVEIEGHRVSDLKKLVYGYAVMSLRAAERVDGSLNVDRDPKFKGLIIEPQETCRTRKPSQDHM